MPSMHHRVSQEPVRGYSAPSSLEKGLLILIILTLPLESHVVLIPGFSLQFLMLAIVGTYLAVNQPWVLYRTLTEPLFLATYAFLLFGLAMEATAPTPSFTEMIRMCQMIGGAVVIASICRNLATLRLALYAFLAAGLWLSVLLFFTSYGAIQGASTTTFEEASNLRAEAFAENPLQANLNGMAFGAGQGAVVAAALMLRANTDLLRLVFGGASMLCMLAACLPLSRSGVIITIVSCAAVLYTSGLRHGKTMLAVALLGIVFLAMVPQSVWSRMTFSFEAHEGKVEGRALVYGAALDHLPEYVLTGVGVGNFWSAWGRSTEFGDGKGRVSGSHNSFLQVTLYWGIGGLLTYVLIFYNAYLCLPRHSHREAASLCLVGLSVSLLLFSFTNHNLYGKEYCLGLGLLASAHGWVWPLRLVPPA